MTAELATVQIDETAILKHLGLNPADPATQALMLVCRRYNLDPVLKHMVPIQGRPYITRDGLLHVAHASGRFDGIVVEEVGETDTHHTARVAVYVKGMSRPVVYPGRYKKNQGNKEYGPEMAIKCAEVMALRRAFDVALPAQEERWDLDEAPVTVVHRGDYELERAVAPELHKEKVTEEGNVVTDWLFENNINPNSAAAALRKHNANKHGRATAAWLRALNDEQQAEILPLLQQMITIGLLTAQPEAGS